MAQIYTIENTPGRRAAGMSQRKHETQNSTVGSITTGVLDVITKDTTDSGTDKILRIVLIKRRENSNVQTRKIIETNQYCTLHVGIKIYHEIIRGKKRNLPTYLTSDRGETITPTSIR